MPRTFKYHRKEKSYNQQEKRQRNANTKSTKLSKNKKKSSELDLEETQQQHNQVNSYSVQGISAHYSLYLIIFVALTLSFIVHFLKTVMNNEPSTSISKEKSALRNTTWNDAVLQLNQKSNYSDETHGSNIYQKKNSIDQNENNIQSGSNIDQIIDNNIEQNEFNIEHIEHNIEQNENNIEQDNENNVDQNENNVDQNENNVEQNENNIGLLDTSSDGTDADDAAVTLFLTEGQQKQSTEHIPVPELKNLTITEFYNLKDSSEPFNSSNYAVFLHFPETGGDILKNIFGLCHRKVIAIDAEIIGHEGDTELEVVEVNDKFMFLNVDITTSAGIKRAIGMGFADNHKADLTITPFLYSMEYLFTIKSKGQIFTLFQHPIERAISMLNYMKYAEDEPEYLESFKTMTIKEYANSVYCKNNYYTRILSNTMRGALNDDHYEIAAYNLRKKIIVGLTDRLNESIDRFEQYFGWRYTFLPSEQEKCRDDYLHQTHNATEEERSSFFTAPQAGAEEYELLSWQNQFDFKLYNIAVELFHEQEILVKGKPENYRLVDTSCTECMQKYGSRRDPTFE